PPEERSAREVQIDQRQHQPPTDELVPGVSAESAAAPEYQREDDGREENAELRAEHPVVHEHPAADGRGEQKGDLRLAEGEHSPPRNEPVDREHEKQDERTDLAEH